MSRRDPADRLRDLSDDELMVVAAELEERAEQFDARVRMQMNDELRRRRMRLLRSRR